MNLISQCFVFVYKWITGNVSLQESTYEDPSSPGVGLLPVDEDTVAQVTVVYNLQKGTTIQSLVCNARSKTEFFSDASNVIKTLANTVSQMLIDDYNMSLIYTSILDNMLHVPPELRKKPN